MERIFNQALCGSPPVGFGYLRLIQGKPGAAPNCVFLDVNTGFEKIMNLPSSCIIGKSVVDILSLKSGVAFNWISYFETVIRTGKTDETTQWINPAGRFYTITSVPLDQEILSVVFREPVSPAPASEQALEYDPAMEALARIFNRTHDAMLLVRHSKGEFRYFLNNSLHKKITGVSDLQNMAPSELLGKELGEKLTQYYETCIRTGNPVSYEQSYDFPSGKRIWHTEITPIFGLNGIDYLLSSSKDVTAIKQVQNENASLTRRLQSMFERHSAMMLIIDPCSWRILDANPAACAFYGYSRTEMQQLLLENINTTLPEEFETLYLSPQAEIANRHVLPYRLKNGDIRLMDDYSCLIPDGRCNLLYSILFEVTDREAYRNALFQEMEVLRTTLRSIGDGVVTTDNTGAITSLNIAAQNITGWESSEACGKPFTDIFLLQNEATGHPVENPVQKVLETGQIIELANHTNLINRHKRAIPIADSAAPIRAEDGQILGVVMVFRDVSNEKTQNDKIRFLSYHDQLTGLFNRHYMEEAMKRLDTEESLPLCIVMGDVNGLKITNDVFGHAAGDALLRQMAISLTKHCQKTDLIARWGGDEVVILMPGTSLATAENILQKMRDDFINIEQSSLRMSMSFGCAIKETMEQSVRAVMLQAEEQMYHRKVLEGKIYRDTIISALLTALHEKSEEMEGHSRRMKKHCCRIGEKLHLSPKELDALALLASLHDIGKVNINMAILQKPGPLTLTEWKEIKRHTEIGYRIAQATPELAMVADSILSHHERWDGQGYPRGIKEAEIPLLCRILSITDAFDAMTNDRVYRRAIPREAAIQELKVNAGGQFDPHITDIFIQTLSVESEGA